MSHLPDDPRAPLRRSVYLLLIVLSAGVMLGRILAVDSVDKLALQRYRIDKIPSELERKERDFRKQGLRGEELNEELDQIEEDLWSRARLRRPFLSANDRSRWCAVRALVEEDLRVEEETRVGNIVYVQTVPYAIDNVIAEPGWDTIDMVKHDGHLYSSKPPLLPTLMAAEYWLIYHTTGLTLGTHPYAVGRFMLVTVNVIPLVICFLLLARLVERFGTTDWGRLFVMGAATFGTFLGTFAVVVNNHLPAAAAAMITLYAVVRIWCDGRRELRYFAVAGLFGAFTAANELPALALLAPVFLALVWKAPRPTLLGFLPAALVVTAGFFGTNWIAHQSLRPPYMHRSETDPADNWYQYSYQRNGREIQSYWQDRTGLDRGQPSRLVYAVHVLVGHHGIFSLTPIWVLSAVGLGLWLRQKDDRRLWELAVFITAVSLVCLVFYLTRPQDDRNYGGMTSGFRWMFWFAPLWLVAMLPALDRMAGRRWMRAVALALLALSVLSASYPTWNPWTHPWLLDGLHYLGWIQV